jgi:hypothetical protein
MWYIESLAAGLCSFHLSLVFILCTEVLNERNLIKRSMYLEVRVNISNFQNDVLHEILEVDPVIILIIPFCCWKIRFLSTETRQNIIAYSIIV